MQLPKYATASFDVDAEKCFTPLCPDELPIEGGDQIVDELNAQAEFARLRIGSKDAHSEKALWGTQLKNRIAQPISPDRLALFPSLHVADADNVDLYWTMHGVPGTLGFELLDGLPKPTEYDYFVWKGVEVNMHPYGACYHDLKDKLSTGVIEFLRHWSIEYVIVGGLALDYCLGLTALQLLKAGFKVIVNLKATKGISAEGCIAMIAKLKAEGAVIINGVEELSAC